MDKPQQPNQYASLNSPGIQDSYVSEASFVAPFKRDDIWVRNDFLGLGEFVRLRILRLYYLTLYTALAIFILIIMAFLFPIDWTDDSRMNILMYKVDQWIKLQNVSSPATGAPPLPLHRQLRRPTRLQRRHCPLSLPAAVPQPNQRLPLRL